MTKYFHRGTEIRSQQVANKSLRHCRGMVCVTTQLYTKDIEGELQYYGRSQQPSIGYTRSFVHNIFFIAVYVTWNWHFRGSRHYFPSGKEWRVLVFLVSLDQQKPYLHPCIVISNKMKSHSILRSKLFLAQTHLHVVYKFLCVNKRLSAEIRS